MHGKYLLLNLMLCAGVGLSPGSLFADTWVKDPTRECTVWSGDDGSAEEVMTWTGSCEDGKSMGLGVLVVHDKDGLAVVYNGEMREGKADGIGSLKFRNDEAAGFDYYIGGFEDGKPVGDGIFDSSEGWSFQAYFEGSFDSGDGTLRVEEDNAVIRGEFVDGELTGVALASYETPTGEYYFGDIENGQRQGLGTLVHPNDDAYIGDFDKGVASGVGAFEGADGSVVVGQFANGSPNGAGTYIAPNGDSYQGLFKDGKAHGMILVTNADGAQSVENWVDGEKQE
jgi:hypothetical protein